MNIKVRDEAENIELDLTVVEGKITAAFCSSKTEVADVFCSVLVGMKLADAAYYAAKITLEKMKLNSAKGISFIFHHPLLNTLEQLLRQSFSNSDCPDSSRFVHDFQHQWEALDLETQKRRISDYIDEFFEGNSLYQPGLAYISHKGLSVSVELASFCPKASIQQTLVRLESFLREKLGNTPVIVLVEERKDANTKRR